MKKIRLLIVPVFLFLIAGNVQAYEMNEFQAQTLLMRNKQHLDLLNYLIVKKDYQSYLEIGICDGRNIRSVIATNKVGVDPAHYAGADYQLTSDEFFAINQETFDLVFIDGLHLCEQVLRDVENALKVLNPGGMIVMHDCLPETFIHQSRTQVPGPWTGDVWKAAAYIRMHLPNVHFCVLDMDWGCGILTPDSSQTLYPEVPLEKLDWAYFVKNRIQLLNVVKLGDWIKTIQ